MTSSPESFWHAVCSQRVRTVGAVIALQMAGAPITHRVMNRAAIIPEQGIPEIRNEFHIPDQNAIRKDIAGNLRGTWTAESDGSLVEATVFAGNK